MRQLFPYILISLTQKTLHQCFNLTSSSSSTPLSVTVLPEVSVVPQNHSLPIPVLQNARAKRDIILPFLAALGVLTGAGTGVARLAYGTTQIQQLANTLDMELQNVAASVIKLRDRIDSRADAALQNRRALDLLLAEKGGNTRISGGRVMLFY